MFKTSLMLILFVASTQICLSASSGGSTDSGSGDGDGSYVTMDEPNIFEKAFELINAKKYSEAYTELKSLDPSKSRDDLNNLLGFTARKSGNLAAAAKYYNAALEINPKHVGALQYQGVLFITLDQIEKAKQNLDRIGKICWLFPCNEERLLEEAISQAVGD